MTTTEALASWARRGYALYGEDLIARRAIISPRDEARYMRKTSHRMAY